jgi:plasmid stabilization system protein ParE
MDAVEELEANLSRFPDIGSGTTQRGILSLPLSRYRYRVYYRVDPDAVRIIRIRHTSRRPPK